MTPDKPTSTPTSNHLRAEQTPFLREVVTILCIRWKIIAFSMGIILATGFTYLHTATKMYEAHGEVLLRQGDRQRDSATAIVRGDYGQYDISERDIKTDVEMLGSSRVVGAALVAMQYEKRIAFSHSRTKRLDASIDEVDTPLPKTPPLVLPKPEVPPPGPRPDTLTGAGDLSVRSAPARPEQSDHPTRRKHHTRKPFFRGTDADRGNDQSDSVRSSTTDHRTGQGHACASGFVHASLAGIRRAVPG